MRFFKFCTVTVSSSFCPAIFKDSETVKSAFSIVELTTLINENSPPLFVSEMMKNNTKNTAYVIKHPATAGVFEFFSSSKSFEIITAQIMGIVNCKSAYILPLKSTATAAENTAHNISGMCFPESIMYDKNAGKIKIAKICKNALAGENARSKKETARHKIYFAQNPFECVSITAHF